MPPGDFRIAAGEPGRVQRSNRGFLTASRRTGARRAVQHSHLHFRRLEFFLTSLSFPAVCSVYSAPKPM